MVKYAIAMLCMLKDDYVLGACISSYALKQLIKESIHKNNIDLIIMCDKYIYKKYGKLLSNYFNKVILINLHHFNWINGYQHLSKTIAKKYAWLNYSVNKWQCLKYDEYDKLLFIDIDILPMKKEFYNIFFNSTPCFHHIFQESMGRHDIDMKKCINNYKTVDILKKYNSFYDYINNNKDYVYNKKSGMGGYTIDGGIVLLKPDKKVYEKYKEFVYRTFEKGLYTFKTSGPDETTLFYFYQKIVGNESYRICDEYLVVPWDSPELAKTTMAYNYIQFIKPWLKPAFLSWPEELLWRKIYNIMPKNGDIKQLFKKTLVYGYDIYLKLDTRQRTKWFNKTNEKDIKEPTYEKIRTIEKKMNI